MKPILFLDVSRLMRRFAVGGGPTGIDRVEIAYGRWLGAQDTFRGVAVARRGRGLSALRPDALSQIVTALDARWSAPAPSALSVPRPLALAAGELRARMLFAAGPLSAGDAPSVYLNVGHDGLDEAGRFDGLPGAFAALISDIIPVTHPEYDTVRATTLMARRVATLVSRADHVACVSAATRDALAAATPQRQFTLSVAHIAPGVVPLARAPAANPTFLHLSSLDRRKNVALLLHIWRRIVEDGETPPRLVLIGRKGNDTAVTALLERCAAIAPFVEHIATARDSDVAQHLSRATGLLSPTFVEGFGLPVLEARAAGTAVIASDIASHREIAGPDAVLCDPLDGPAWRRAIAAFCAERPEPLPQAVPGWGEHFATMAPVLRALAR